LVTLLPLFSDKRLLKDAKNSSLINVATTCLNRIDETMKEPDNGLWEFRGTSQLHSYTFLFHWAGSHAAKKIAKITGDQAMEQKANRLIEESTKPLDLPIWMLVCYS